MNHRLPWLHAAATALFATLLLAAPLTRAATPAPVEVSSAEADPASKTITAAFKAALAGDFDAYLATIHPAERANKTQISSLRRYSWARFTRQAAWYLVDRDPKSFVIAKRDTTGSDKLRVFLKDQTHEARMPVPVRLRLVTEGPDKGQWRITTNSL